MSQLGLKCRFFFQSRNGKRWNEFNMLWNAKCKKAVTWYAGTRQVRGSRSPSSINSSSWLRPGMSPMGLVGLNIAWSTALSCVVAISLASVQTAKKQTVTAKLQLGGKIFPLKIPAPASANWRRGRKQRWTLRFAICTWLSQKNAAQATFWARPAKMLLWYNTGHVLRKTGRSEHLLWVESL